MSARCGPSSSGRESRGFVPAVSPPSMRGPTAPIGRCGFCGRRLSGSEWGADSPDKRSASRQRARRRARRPGNGGCRSRQAEDPGHFWNSRQRALSPRGRFHRHRACRCVDEALDVIRTTGSPPRPTEGLAKQTTRVCIDEVALRKGRLGVEGGYLLLATALLTERRVRRACTRTIEWLSRKISCHPSLRPTPVRRRAHSARLPPTGPGLLSTRHRRPGALRYRQRWGSDVQYDVPARAGR